MFERAGRSHRRGRLDALGFGLPLVLGAVAGGIAGALVARSGDEDRAPIAASIDAVSPDGPANASWRAVAERARRGVVEITVSRTVTLPGLPGAPPEEDALVGVGSGFVIDRAGDIVTGSHVVEDADAITVHFADGAAATARRVGSDPSTDLAVLRVSSAGQHLHPLAFGSVASLAPGVPVLAIGAPFGYGGSVSAGVVSALGREITSPSGYTLSDAIQTDAAINHGSSGGPLIDRTGRVVAVNVQLADSGVDGNVGVSFAVPMDAGNRSAIEQLRTTGRVSHAWLGVSGITVDQALAAATSASVTSGAMITGIASGSPAAKSGLRAGSRPLVLDSGSVCAGGDVVVAVGGNRVESMNDLQHEVDSLRPGTRTTIAVIRADGSRASLTATLDAQPGTAPDIEPGCE